MNDKRPADQAADSPKLKLPAISPADALVPVTPDEVVQGPRRRREVLGNILPDLMSGQDALEPVAPEQFGSNGSTGPSGSLDLPDPAGLVAAPAVPPAIPDPAEAVDPNAASGPAAAPAKTPSIYKGTSADEPLGPVAHPARPYVSAIRAQHFGSMGGQGVDGFGPGLNVVFAANEGGKSTVTNLLVGVLFGFLHRGRDRNTYAPANAKRSGEVAFEVPGAEPVTVARAESKLTARLAGSKRNLPKDAADELHARLTQNTDRANFERLFVVTAENRPAFAGVDELSRQVMARALGLPSSPADALKSVDDEIAALKSARKEHPEALGNLAALRSELKLQVDRDRAHEDTLVKDRVTVEDWSRTEPALAERAAALAALSDELADMLLTANHAFNERSRLNDALRANALRTAALATDEARLRERAASFAGFDLVAVEDGLATLDTELRLAERLADIKREGDSRTQSPASTSAAGEVTHPKARRALLAGQVACVALTLAFAFVAALATGPLRSVGIVLMVVAGLGGFALMSGLPWHEALVAALAKSPRFADDPAADKAAADNDSAAGTDLDPEATDATAGSAADPDSADPEPEDLKPGLADAEAFLTALGISTRGHAAIAQGREELGRAKQTAAELAQVDAELETLARAKAADEAAVDAIDRDAAALSVRLDQALAAADFVQPDLNQVQTASKPAGQGSDPAFELEQRIRATQRTLATETRNLTDRLERGRTEAGIARSRLEAAGTDAFLATKQELARTDTRILDTKRRLATLLLERHALDRALADWKRDSEQGVFERASRLFAEMTCGEWTEIALGEGGSLELRRADGGDADPAILSTSTVGLLDLALRLAFVEALGERAGWLPVVCDDALVHLDHDRREATARALARFARERQTILFTCHGSTAQLLARTDPAARICSIARTPGA